MEIVEFSVVKEFGFTVYLETTTHKQQLRGDFVPLHIVEQLEDSLLLSVKDRSKFELESCLLTG